ncbi:hypothetical protein N172_18170 [Pantoea dispersa EGD-AAK13]|nr:hypothetical protein N172_18170 [Pantoea dispersa EGD-AAK13]KAF0855853.1 hypothetical protein Y788_08855 [Pantoea dispersa 625]
MTASMAGERFRQESDRDRDYSQERCGDGATGTL